MASTIWRGFITFGLISIPVRLFRAARAERVSFRRLYRSEPSSSPGSSVSERVSREVQQDEEAEESAPERAGKPIRRLEAVQLSRSAISPALAPEPFLAPVQQASVRKGTDEVVAQKSLVKGYEYEKDRFVAIDPEELKSIAPKTATEMEIQEFVQLAEIDPVYFETSYYVTPEEAGGKAYALLHKALQTAGLVAVAQFAMHNREHVVVLRPGKKGLIAHTMFFSSEVRADEEYRADAGGVTAKELSLAEMLIQSLTAPFEPEKYRDTYREKLEEIIAKKVAGTPVPVAEEPSRRGSVVDITDALQRSLATLKKPAGAEPVARAAEPKAEGATPKRISRRAGAK